MESNKDVKKIQFTVAADDKEALEKAIRDINLQSKSDYELICHELHEVGLGTIEVSEDKIIPEFLFMMGYKYRIFSKKIRLNF